jgi:hypothetical protein
MWASFGYEYDIIGSKIRGAYTDRGTDSRAMS